MAEIHRATRDGPAGFAKQVVIKTVLPDLCRDRQFVEMFLEEARLAARLSSPNLVQVFDFGHEEGTYYLVMEHVDGLDLATLLARRGRLPPALCLHLGRQLCVALADLHGATDEGGEPLEIVHRDVNPGNVLLSRKGDVKLGDLGIAKSAARGMRTDRGTVKGKLAYLSPEQARGEEVDGRADLYGLGLILFEALTGQRYLSATGEVELLRQAERPEPRAPSELVTGLPAGLDKLLARALALDPARRFPDARQLDAALARIEVELDAGAAREQLAALVRAALEDEAPAATPASPPRRAEAPRPSGPATGPSTEVMDAAEPRGRTPKRVLVLGLLGAAVAGAVALVLVVVPRSDPRSGAVVPADAAARVRADAAAPIDAALRDRRVAPDRSVQRDRPPRNQVDSGAVVPRRKRIRSHAPARPRPQPRADARAPDSAPRPPRSDLRPRLEAVDRLLEQRGLLRADVPKIAARRRELAAAVARGEAVGGELDRLEARVRSFVIDRTFVERKLRRLTRAMAGRALPAGVEQRIQRHAQRALSHAVTRRYADANRELNQIARLLRR
jgi:hypothetical protein